MSFSESAIIAAVMSKQRRYHLSDRDTMRDGCADSLEMRSSSRGIVVAFTECTNGLREMLENNNNATNPKPPFDFHEIMIVLFLILLVVYSVRAAIWFLMH